MPSSLETLSTLPDSELDGLISDFFHALSQPLTTLRCSLELTLQQSRTAEQYRDVVSRALAQAERASWLAGGIRELFDASRAGENFERLFLQSAIQEVVRVLLPVAESAGVRICYLPGSTCPVSFEARRLRQALFHLFGFVVASSGQGAVVQIEVADRVKDVVLALTVSRTTPRPDQQSLPISSQECESQSGEDDDSDCGKAQELDRRLGLGIARAIFELAGANFHAESQAECLNLEVRFRRTPN